MMCGASWGFHDSLCILKQKIWNGTYCKVLKFLSNDQTLLGGPYVPVFSLYSSIHGGHGEEVQLSSHDSNPRRIDLSSRLCVLILVLQPEGMQKIYNTDSKRWSLIKYGSLQLNCLQFHAS